MSETGTKVVRVTDSVMGRVVALLDRIPGKLNRRDAVDSLLLAAVEMTENKAPRPQYPGYVKKLRALLNMEEGSEGQTETEARFARIERSLELVMETINQRRPAEPPSLRVAEEPPTPKRRKS